MTLAQLIMLSDTLAVIVMFFFPLTIFGVAALVATVLGRFANT
jgi:hypothetical protein